MQNANVLYDTVVDGRGRHLLLALFALFRVGAEGGFVLPEHLVQLECQGQQVVEVEWLVRTELVLLQHPPHFLKVVGDLLFRHQV